jgi:cell division protein FtsW
MKQYIDLDYQLVIITAILSLTGCVMVFSSSMIMADVRFNSPYMFISKHLLWVIMGILGLVFFAGYDYRKLQKNAYPLFFVTIFLLAAVLVFGTTKGGAKRWFKLGAASFQPSELAKLAVVLVVSDYLDRKKSKLKNIAGLLPVLGLAAALCAFIVLEPDLGTPAIIFAVTISMLFVSGARINHLMLIGLGAVPLLVVDILRKPYRLARIKSFITSWWDIRSASYQLDQSIVALGSGGFLGKGLAQGQMKLFFLPEAHTDFIFPIIGEELGFVGTVFLVALFAAFAYRGWTISKAARDLFGSMLALGLTLLIVYQAVLNMSVASGLLPTKGLPLPFVSFGGTALVINFIEVGILLNIAKRSKLK